MQNMENMALASLDGIRYAARSIAVEAHQEHVISLITSSRCHISSWCCRIAFGWNYQELSE